MNLHKRVLPKNDMTGNVSLTYDEWDKVYHGETIYLTVTVETEHRRRRVSVEITDHMINQAWQCKWRECIIMPYATP